MKIIKNIGTIDKVFRLIISEILLIIAIFWTSGVLQIILYILAFILIITSVLSFCGLYKMLKINTYNLNKKSLSRKVLIVITVLMIAIAILGSYFSIFFTKKFFLEDYTKMNQYYKQTLFYTGQNDREKSIENYNNLVLNYEIFYKKYSRYHPYTISMDKNFDNDIGKIRLTILALKDSVLSGNLPSVHQDFEIIRPIFQDILKRNNFSLLAISLVDFHDAMEKIITAADAKDENALISIYPEVDLKLKEVENIVNDTEIQNIRTKLNEVLSLAQSGQIDLLSSKAAELKSAFVKVYLKRG
jgi:hypothetical protein